MKTLTVSSCRDCPFAFTHCKEVSKSGIKEDCPLMKEDIIITVAKVLKGEKMEGNSFERYVEIYNSYFIAEKLKELEKLMEENKDVLIRLKNGKEYPECPVFDTSCPYCLASGECTLTHPEDECDDYYYYNGEEEEEDEI